MSCGSSTCTGGSGHSRVFLTVRNFGDGQGLSFKNILNRVWTRVLILKADCRTLSELLLFSLCARYQAISEMQPWNTPRATSPSSSKNYFTN